MTTREGLIRMRELLTPPGAWTQGAGARSRDGNASNYRDSSAVCWCLVGASFRVDGGFGAHNKRVEVMYRVQSDLRGLSAWNDAPCRTQAEVLDLLDRAIAATPT